MTETALAKLQGNAFGLDVQRVVEQTIVIQQVMKAVMRPGEHFGVVPGTERKDADGNDISRPSLYQPGADKLCLLFRLRPEYEDTINETESFISIKVRCRLVHIQTGEVWGEGMGSANSREAKYLNQATAKVCPRCGKAAIIKGRVDYGGGWLCYGKKGGCGTKFTDDSPEIVGSVGQVNNDKIWDLHNTLLKMACKRAKVAAVLTATAASDIFTQDLEDLEDARDGGGDESSAGGRDGRDEQPAKRGGGGGNGGNQKRATPLQVRDLNMALNELQIGQKEAGDRRGREREAVVLQARLAWCAGMLGHDVKTMTELGADQADSLIKAAQAGEMPSTPPADAGGEGKS